MNFARSKPVILVLGGIIDLNKINELFHRMHSFEKWGTLALPRASRASRSRIVSIGEGVVVAVGRYGFGWCRCRGALYLINTRLASSLSSITPSHVLSDLTFIKLSPLFINHSKYPSISAFITLTTSVLTPYMLAITLTKPSSTPLSLCRQR